MDTLETKRQSILASIEEFADVATVNDAMAVKRLANFADPAVLMTNITLRDTIIYYQNLLGIPIYVVSKIEGTHTWYKIFFHLQNIVALQRVMRKP